MTCNVFGGTLSLTQSINHKLEAAKICLVSESVLCQRTYGATCLTVCKQAELVTTFNSELKGELNLVNCIKEVALVLASDGKLFQQETRR